MKTHAAVVTARSGIDLAAVISPTLNVLAKGLPFLLFIDGIAGVVQNVARYQEDLEEHKQLKPDRAFLELQREELLNSDDPMISNIVRIRLQRLEYRFGENRFNRFVDLVVGCYIFEALASAVGIVSVIMTGSVAAGGIVLTITGVGGVVLAVVVVTAVGAKFIYDHRYMIRDRFQSFVAYFEEKKIRWHIGDDLAKIDEREGKIIEELRPPH